MIIIEATIQEVITHVQGLFSRTLRWDAMKKVKLNELLRSIAKANIPDGQRLAISVKTYDIIKEAEAECLNWIVFIGKNPEDYKNLTAFKMAFRA